MAQTPEQKVKAKIRLTLRNLGHWYCTPIGSAFGHAGIPDFLVCARGRFVGIEAKAAGGRLTALQSKVHSDIRQGGGVVLMIDPSNVEALPELLRQALEQPASR